MGGGVYKHPKTIATRVNGFWLDSENQPISFKDITKLAADYDRIFVKESEDSAGGKGVSVWHPNEGIERLKEITDRIKVNVLLQKGVIQHEVLNKLNSSSLNTIRALSFIRSNGEARVLSVSVRMGRAGKIVDNAHSGGLVAGVSSDGRLKPRAFDVDGKEFTHHPDSNVAFDEIVLPNYDKLVETVKRLAWMLPQFRLLSWDLAIDEKGDIVIIEVNLHSGGLDVNQLTNGPVFKELTEEVLDEVFSRNKA